jgi:hypothetical protein
VDLITAETLSPIFSFISSALRLVITPSIIILAHAYHVRHYAAKFQLNDFACQAIPSR